MSQKQLEQVLVENASELAAGPQRVSNAGRLPHNCLGFSFQAGRYLELTVSYAPPVLVQCIDR